MGNAASRTIPVSPAQLLWSDRKRVVGLGGPVFVWKARLLQMLMSVGVGACGCVQMWLHKSGRLAWWAFVQLTCSLGLIGCTSLARVGCMCEA